MARGKKKEELTLEEKLEQALVPVEEQPYEVPKNWCWVKWGAIGEFIAGNGFKKEFQGFTGYKIPFYKVGSLKYADDFGYLYDESNTITEEMRMKLKATLIPRNCILFAKIGEAIRLNRRCLNKKECCIDNNTMAFLTNSCNFRYVYYWTLAQEFYDLTNATTVPAIRKSDLEIISFPLPPLREQQRIVERIESLFAKLDESKEKLQFVQDSSDDNFASTVHEALTGNLTKEWREQNGISRSDWKKSKLGNLGCLERGRSKHRPRNDSKLFGGSYPFIQTGDVAESDVYIEKHKQTLSEFGLAQSRMFPKGTLCITIAANIGDVAILSYDCCFPDSVVGFTPYKDVESKYIYYMMRELQKEIEATAPATAQKNINLKILNNINIIIPSVIEQREIIRILDNLYDKKKQTEEKVEQVVDAIDMMKKSILAKAFRGELGTNNLKDESSVSLLKQILEQGNKK